MRQTIFAFVIVATTILAAPATAEESPLLPVTWDGSLAEPWSPPAPVSFDERAQQQGTLNDVRTVSAKVEKCQSFKVLWSESSARKLYRALRYNDAALQKVDLQPWVDVRVTSYRGLQPFSVHAQNSGYSAGIVPLNPDWNFTYVVAQTANGPVVASQTWPSANDLDNGATCRPVASRIEFPDDRRVDVNIEPFRMWGMRVAEKLPANLFETTSYDALVTVIRATDGSNASVIY